MKTNVLWIYNSGKNVGFDEGNLRSFSCDNIDLNKHYNKHYYDIKQYTVYGMNKNSGEYYYNTVLWI